MIGMFTLTLAMPAPATERTDGFSQWDFDVYLDDRKVGKHQFKVSELGAEKQVKSEASFQYKILFISAYWYEHSTAERWTNDCLVEFDASANANGKRTVVSGEKSDAGFYVDRGDSPIELPPCVMTFAYWNPVFLDQPRLLNPQTGQYMDIRVELS